MRGKLLADSNSAGCKCKIKRWFSVFGFQFSVKKNAKCVIRKMQDQDTRLFNLPVGRSASQEKCKKYGMQGARCEIKTVLSEGKRKYKISV
jgi:hypothetical protein